MGENYGVYLEYGVKAAKAAGKILLDKLEKGVEIRHKGEIDLVTEADTASEQCILDILQAQFPDHSYLAEESNQVLDLNDPYIWIIDPLDGTTNFAHGYRCFCVSIALRVHNDLKAGIVYDPCANEMYTALRGGGAFLNGDPVSVSKNDTLRNSLLVTGFPYDIGNGKIFNVKLFNHFLSKAQAVRRDGSAALDLAYVAAGRFDGFWELKLNPWDVAAGILIVEEAGGKVSNYRGDTFKLDAIDLLVTNNKIHDSMVKEILSFPEDQW